MLCVQFQQLHTFVKFVLNQKRDVPEEIIRVHEHGFNSQEEEEIGEKRL